VKRKALRKACNTASKKKDKAVFYLMYSPLNQNFTIQELANSKWSGVGRGQGMSTNQY
jgi:hypothetical protein